MQYAQMTCDRRTCEIEDLGSNILKGRFLVAASRRKNPTAGVRRFLSMLAKDGGDQRVPFLFFFGTWQLFPHFLQSKRIVKINSHFTFLALCDLPNQSKITCKKKFRKIGNF